MMIRNLRISQSLINCFLIVVPPSKNKILTHAPPQSVPTLDSPTSRKSASNKKLNVTCLFPVHTNIREGKSVFYCQYLRGYYHQ